MELTWVHKIYLVAGDIYTDKVKNNSGSFFLAADSGGR
jgi:hypothetical protein